MNLLASIVQSDVSSPRVGILFASFDLDNEI